MEASEMPKISLSRVETRGIFGLVGDDSAVQELISNDDRGSGFARLELMVGTVLERLTEVEPPASKAGA
jgi:hypothetical protein